MPSTSLLERLSFGRRRRARGHFLQGDRDRDAGRWADAAESYRLGLALQPKAFAFWVQLGHALKETEDMSGAEAAYQRAYSISPEDADLNVQLGHYYARVGLRDRAAEYYEKAIDLGSNDTVALAACKGGDSTTLNERAERALLALLDRRHHGGGRNELENTMKKQNSFASLLLLASNSRR
jgi:tetratricopeptide (TPR) repeat protein